MSIRTYVEGIQIFGNNCTYEKWNEFIKSQGIEVSEEGCYDGYITDFPKAIEVMQEITLDIYKYFKEDAYDKRNIFDLSYILEDYKDSLEKYGQECKFDLFKKLNNLTRDSYLFMTYQLYRICECKLKYDFIETEDGSKVLMYTLRDGEKIRVTCR